MKRQKNRPLVIIDMQDGYIATNDIEPNILREIKEAKKDNRWIVVVKFQYDRKRWGNPILPSIQKTLKNYKHTISITKAENDGSEQIVEVLDECSVDYDTVEICGINTDACVIETVESLSLYKHIKEIWVNGHACSAEIFMDHLNALKKMSKWEKVFVI